MSMFGHILRMAAGTSGPPEIGEPWEGGFYAGDYGGYHYVIADKSSEASLQWKTSSTTTSGTTSTTDGWANTNAMNNSSHPAAQYCRAYRGGGFDDWFLLSRDETNDLYWLNLAPGGASTPVDFRSGGAQALTTTDFYWTSTESAFNNAWGQNFSDGGQSNSRRKIIILPVRPARRIPA